MPRQKTRAFKSNYIIIECKSKYCHIQHNYVAPSVWNKSRWTRWTRKLLKHSMTHSENGEYSEVIEILWFFCAFSFLLFLILYLVILILPRSALLCVCVLNVFVTFLYTKHDGFAFNFRWIWMCVRERAHSYAYLSWYSGSFVSL